MFLQRTIGNQAVGRLLQRQIEEEKKKKKEEGEKEFVYHTVKSGDTLIKLSEFYGVGVGLLLEWNPEIKHKDWIYVGQKIKLRVGSVIYGTTRKLLVEFITGAPSSYSFGANHPWTLRLKLHPHMARVREYIRNSLLSYCERPANLIEGQFNFNLNDLSVLETIQWLAKDIEAWLSIDEEELHRAFVFGSFRLKWAARAENIKCTEDRVEATIHFLAKDLLHLGSALRIPKTSIGPSDEPFGRGAPFNNIPIEWNWTETITTERK
jgi:hypothetical protein